MKKISVLFVFIFSSAAYACPNIVGTWMSSKELSLEYNLKNVRMEPHTVKFIEDVYGVLKITYTKSTVRMHGAPTKKITIKGKQYDFVYEENTSEYKTVSCDKNTITIFSNGPYSTGDLLITFIDENTYWVMTMPGSDKREYFIRVPNDI